MALQDIAGDNQIIPRDRAWLENLFAQGNRVFGVTDDDGILVAQAILRLNTAAPKGLSRVFDDTALACISCVLVNPNQRGRGLMGHLLEACLDAARKDGQQEIIARVKVGNDASLNNFLKRDFTIVAIGPSPEDPDRIVHSLRLSL
ncbi:MAG: GNAT family N-acetyltransferase [Micavibrio aeruginosavorus]|nr:GNAT family N-acetyltransferase [Micavibrio aeruginosavorus]